MNQARSSYQPGGWMGYGSVQSRPTTYETLMRQSRLLGRVATQAFDITRHLIIDSATPFLRSAGSTERRFFESNPDRIHTLAVQSHEVLTQIRTLPLLPHNLFPDTLIVDRMKVKIVLWKTFFLHETVIILFGDIKHISVSTGVMFSSLTLSHQDGDITLNGFWNRDAELACCMIRGYRMALREGVQVETLTTERLKRKLLELGGGGREV